MPVKFKLSPEDKTFFHGLIKFNKEYGGVLNIHNGKILNKTSEKGGNYSVSYNQKNDKYEISYHSHAYCKQNHHLNSSQIMKKIETKLSNNTNDALFLFECDIMQVHPPSPQDCYVCSLRYKQGMLVCAQEGMYEMKYINQHPIDQIMKGKIEEQYYKLFWGESRRNVSKLFQSANHESIMKCIRICNKHHKKNGNNVLIDKYLKYIRKKGFICKLIPWENVSEHVFFS